MQVIEGWIKAFAYFAFFICFLLVIFFVIVIFASKQAGAETLSGTIIETQPLTRNTTVSIPYEKCDMVRKVIPITRGANQIYNTDDIFQRMFKKVTAPTATIYVEECKTLHRTEVQTVLEGFLVTYELGGKVYQTRTKLKPESDKIDVKISHSIQ
jgi:hypothetical protein